MWKNLLCSCSVEPAGGAAERHEGRRHTSAQHAVQDPTGVGTTADVGAEHPEPSDQSREWASAAGESWNSGHLTYSLIQASNRMFLEAQTPGLRLHTYTTQKTIS